MPKEAKNDQILNDLEQLRALTTVLADTSSLIYLDKLSLLKLLSREIKLITIEEVASEFGFGPPHRLQVTILAGLSQSQDYPKLNTDRKLIAQAIAGKHCLLSDDRRILRAAIDMGLQAHCAIMMVLLLHFRGLIDLPAYEKARNQLADWARYDRRLISYADELCFMFGKFFG